MSIVSTTASSSAVAFEPTPKGAQVAQIPSRKAWLEQNHPDAKNAAGKRLYAAFLQSTQPLMAACQNKAVDGMAMVKVTLSASGNSATVRYVRPPATKETQATKYAKLAKRDALRSAKYLLESNVSMDVITVSLGLTAEEVDAYVEANS